MQWQWHSQSPPKRGNGNAAKRFLARADISKTKKGSEKNERKIANKKEKEREKKEKKRKKILEEESNEERHKL